MKYGLKMIIIPFILSFAASISSCAMKRDVSPEFEYKAIDIGFGEEGYLETEISAGTWQLKIIAIKDHSYETLKYYFYKRASEICSDEPNLKEDIKLMADVCPEGGCFKRAIKGVFSCK